MLQVILQSNFSNIAKAFTPNVIEIGFYLVILAQIDRKGGKLGHLALFNCFIQDACRLKSFLLWAFGRTLA